jgi:hypothetical protein
MSPSTVEGWNDARMVKQILKSYKLDVLSRI